MKRIGLIDVDSHNFPNIALMKISAYHKAQGDDVSWYDHIFGGHYDRVYMSKVFSFSEDYCFYINADEVVKGGSGYAISTRGGENITTVCLILLLMRQWNMSIRTTLSIRR